MQNHANSRLSARNRGRNLRPGQNNAPRGFRNSQGSSNFSFPPGSGNQSHRGGRLFPRGSRGHINRGRGHHSMRGRGGGYQSSFSGRGAPQNFRNTARGMQRGRGRGAPQNFRGNMTRGRGGFAFPSTRGGAQNNRGRGGFTFPSTRGGAKSNRGGLAFPSTEPQNGENEITLKIPEQKRERKASEVIKDIKKSPADKKEYRILRLQNDLTVLLIRDKEAHHSSASLSVNTGALQDPKEYKGLAHFLEHMLFKGSEKYPDEGLYSQFVSMNGGSVNAYTSLFETNYYFNIDKRAFYQALDIFAQFYKNPLLKPESVGQEVKAVHSEFEMNKTDEGRKIFMVKRALADKDSLFNKFTDGNLKTLNKKGVVLALKTFHDRNYSANQMALVISTPDDLDIMQYEVENIFTGIKNKKIKGPDYSKEKFPYKENLKKIVKVAPNKDMDEVEIVFNLESLQDASKETKVLQYLTNIFSFEGEGSLHDLLVWEGLANDVKARGEHHKDYFSTFTVEVKLTSEGLKKWKKVVTAVVAFIKFLQRIGPQKWYFEEASKMSELAFNYPEKMETTEMVKVFSAALIDTDDDELKDFLYKGVDFGEFNEKLIKDVTNDLTSSRAQIFLISDEFKDEVGLKTESYYKGRYKIEDMSEENLAIFRNPDSFEWQYKPEEYFKMPLNNFLIPNNFDLVKPENNRKIIKRTVWRKNSEVYHLHETEFKDPMVCIALQVYENDDDPREFYSSAYYALRLIWANCFKEYFGVESYHARTARCVFSFEQQQKFFHMKGKCFSDSLEPFLDELTESLTNFLQFEECERCMISQNGFESIRENMIIGMKNSLLITPYQLGMSQLDWILTDCNLDPQSIINELEKINFEDFKIFAKEKAFKNIRFEWLFEGNIQESKAREYSTGFEAKLLKYLRSTGRGNTLKKINTGCSRPIQLRESKTAILEFPVLNEEETNSSFIKLYEMGLGIGASANAQEDKIFALSTFFSAFLRDEYFADLRGRQQLGYVVFCFPKTVNGVYYLGFCAQSNTNGSHFLQQKTQEFLAKMNQKIRMMPAEQLEAIKSGISAGFGKKWDNVDEKFSNNLIEIISHQFKYNRKKVRAQAIMNLTMEEIVEFWQNKIVRNFRSLELHLYAPEKRDDSQATRNQRVKEEKETYFYENLANFRLKQGLYPDEGSMLK